MSCVIQTEEEMELYITTWDVTSDPEGTAIAKDTQ